MRQTALNAVYDLAKRDDRVVFVGSDLGAGVLQKFKNEMPDRYFMEGVSEQALIGMCAGLAMDGFIPYFNTIATFFTRRAFEQIAVDLCLHNLPVRMLASGGGAVYAPLGPTHMALEDIGAMRLLPNMTIFAPVDAPEMTRVVEATLTLPGPAYIRFAKGGDPIVSSERGFAIGKAIKMRDGGDIGIVSTGVMTTRSLKAAEELEANGIRASVLHVHTIKPLDEQAILELAGTCSTIATIEEHSVIGGLGSAVTDLLAKSGVSVRQVRLGFADAFVGSYGSQDSVLEAAGLQPPQLAQTLAAALERPTVSVR